MSNFLNYFIAAVWLANGLFCKVLNLVPRHQKIVERILGIGNARLLTVAIGLSEIAMAVWILSGIKIRIEDSDSKDIPLPANSPFADWKEARRFAGPLPFTFTYNPSDKTVLIIEGVRENWKPKPVRVIDCNFSFIDNFKLNDVRLANAFMIRNIPYYWKKGKIEQWNKKEENSRVF